MNNSDIEQSGQQIANAQKLLVTSHLRPDGDAIGSVLGLGLALQSAGKEVQMVLEDGVPKSFRHLAGSDQIKNKATDTDVCTIVVDCSDRTRIGNVLPADVQPVINIDHHKTNLNFAAINLVNSKATATTEILTKLLPVWGLPIHREIADALLTGLITDTLGFRVAGVTSDTLRTAADLFDLGANLSTLYAKALLTRSFEAARYWGTGLSALQLENRLLWTRLTLEDREIANYPGRDDADLINILQTVEDADIFVIFIEQKNGTVKVSWRAKPGYDVSEVALQFGGGGHKPAAGAEIQGNIDDVIYQVLSVTRLLLNGTHPKM